MREQTYFLSFDEISEIEANRYIEKSREVLLGVSNKLDVQRQRENPLVLDLSTYQALIIGTPAFVMAIKAIGNSLQKRHCFSLTIVTEYLTNKDAMQLLHMFLAQNAERKECAS